VEIHAKNASANSPAEKHQAPCQMPAEPVRRRRPKGQLSLPALLRVSLLLVSLLTACAPLGQPTLAPTQPAPATTAPRASAVVATSPAAASVPSPAPELAAPSATPAAVYATAVASEAKLYELLGARMYPEGIAFDATTGFFYTGSLTDGALMRGNLETGAVTIFSPAGVDDRAMVVGMEVDAVRRRLWVAGGSTQRMYVYDLDTARLLRQYVISAGTSGSLINDVALTPVADAFFTNSRRPVLWRIGAGDRDAPGELEPWLDLSGGPIPYGASLNLNGIVATPDGLHLIAVHTDTGKLFRFAVTSRETQEIALNTSVQRGDGLALDGTTLRKVGDRLLVVNSQANTLSGGRPILPFTITSIPFPS
jgi:hypothetical protein